MRGGYYQFSSMATVTWLKSEIIALNSTEFAALSDADFNTFAELASHSLACFPSTVVARAGRYLTAHYLVTMIPTYAGARQDPSVSAESALGGQGLSRSYARKAVSPIDSLATSVYGVIFKNLQKAFTAGGYIRGASY